MKVSLIAISIIIALQATSFIHGSQQRYNYHHTLHQFSQGYKSFKGPSSSTNCSCYEFSEEIRIGIIALMYGSALLLFTGESVFPAFLAQALWIVSQGYFCTEMTLPNIRNLAVQLLILFVLASHIKCCDSNSKCSIQSKKSTQEELEQTGHQQETKSAQSKVRKQERQEKDTKNNKESATKTQKTAKSKKSN